MAQIETRKKIAALRLAKKPSIIALITKTFCTDCRKKMLYNYTRGQNTAENILAIINDCPKCKAEYDKAVKKI